MGRWSYPNVKTKSTPDGTVKLDWEIDGQTVKALKKDVFIKAIEFGVGVRGKFPIKYTIVGQEGFFIGKCDHLSMKHSGVLY